MAPMTTWSGNKDGTISDEELDYYAYRSSGVGLVITATTYVEPLGRALVVSSMAVMTVWLLH